MTLVHRTASPDDMADVMAIRWTVFVDEQSVPAELERDELDATATHLLVLEGGSAIATGRIVREEPGYHGVPEELGHVAHLGRLAVLADRRGTGAGAYLLAALEDAARDLGLRVAQLGSQTHAIGFYERGGWVAYGPEFDDAGIPHRAMWKPLS